MQITCIACSVHLSWDRGINHRKRSLVAIGGRFTLHQVRIDRAMALYRCAECKHAKHPEQIN